MIFTKIRMETQTLNLNLQDWPIHTSIQVNTTWQGATSPPYGSRPVQQARVERMQIHSIFAKITLIKLEANNKRKANSVQANKHCTQYFRIARKHTNIHFKQHKVPKRASMHWHASEASKTRIRKHFKSKYITINSAQTEPNKFKHKINNSEHK